LDTTLRMAATMAPLSSSDGAVGSAMGLCCASATGLGPALGESDQIISYLAVKQTMRGPEV
jgi:hypothetical protein